ncbi:dynein regulatory complex protein 8-like [Argiope bruennichi]|uniref:dynein regulatory complex protein 8-like n=1 Tax=Argiope bruennichi TaxID=94029 RepID=UPI0024958226|nr:dynein regulatory complex protein 8-like [Argiope bruennichi]
MFKTNAKPDTSKKSSYEAFTEKQIAEAFEVFDEDRKGRAKLKHLGSIIRAMGRVPTQSELEDMGLEIEDQEYPGYFRLEKLLPPLTKILMKDEWKPASKEEIIKAFRVLDSDRKGYLEVEQLRKLFLQHGDKFPADAIEKFLGNAPKDSSGKINYKDFSELLVVPHVFDIAENRREIREKLVDDRYRMC